MERLLRPSGIFLGGVLELGLEVLLDGDRIVEVRPHTGIPDAYVLSPAFVNTHSHLEYRGLQGKLAETDYWPWIREITMAKLDQNLEDVAADAALAARENVAAGVALIGEHSDRPVSGPGVAETGGSLRGVLFQEVITRFEQRGPAARIAESRNRLGVQRAAFDRAFLIPHAYQTVDELTLREFGASGRPFSIHVAESDLENELTLSGTGAIAQTFKQFGVAYEPTGKRLVESLADLGLVRRGAQFVHCCALNSNEVGLLAEAGVTVAHCPRSNSNLHCPAAPVREMLDAGMLVGLGLDSAASSGPIDMFAEMREALRVSIDRGRPVAPEEVWNSATEMGADSLRFALPDLEPWRIEPGSNSPLIRIDVSDAYSTRDVIERGSIDLVERI